MSGRLALIADIHGNLVALDAVLAALARDGVDRIVCLGDVAVLGPQPREVVARLQELGCPCVMGNTDVWLLAESASTSSVGAELTRWCADRLSETDRAFLRSFQPTIDVPLDGGLSLLCFHGSPRSFDDVIAATTPSSELKPLLGDHGAAILAGGHTHVQLLRRLDQGCLINPGSVGLPGVGPGTPDLPVNQSVRWAEYAVIGFAGEGFSIDLRRLPLDLDRVLAAARASGMPHVDWWAGLWDSPSSP